MEDIAVPTTYEVVGLEVLNMVRDVIKKWHPQLGENGVTLDVMFARGHRDKYGTTTRPAITVGGYVAQASIRVNSLKERVRGACDATLLIDGDNWKDLTVEEQECLIDHELEHLVFVRDKKIGIIKTDDAGRPKLKLKKHDWQFGGFNAVANRHKQISSEVQFIAGLGRRAVEQGWLPGF